MLTLDGMGGERTDQRHVCEDCGDPERVAYERGAIPLGVVRCDPCWNRLANELAQIDGATGAPRPDPGPESFEPAEPDECPQCGMEVRTMPTNYDRWVRLTPGTVRAKEVPRRYWWRIETIRARHSTYVVGRIAVRVSGIEPLPDDVVTTAHTAFCQDPRAIEEVRQARRNDVARQLWVPASAVDYEDE
jgi:hypothetical protein